MSDDSLQEEGGIIAKIPSATKKGRAGLDEQFVEPFEMLKSCRVKTGECQQFANMMAENLRTFGESKKMPFKRT